MCKQFYKLIFNPLYISIIRSVFTFYRHFENLEHTRRFCRFRLCLTSFDQTGIDFSKIIWRRFDRKKTVSSKNWFFSQKLRQIKSLIVMTQSVDFKKWPVNLSNKDCPIEIDRYNKEYKRRSVKWQFRRFT